MLKFQEFKVETDTRILRTHCCGLDYKIDADPVPLKPDSEYPDWLFAMDLKRPEPPSHEMEYGTMEYFEKQFEEGQARERRLNSKWNNLKRRRKREKGLL